MTGCFDCTRGLLIGSSSVWYALLHEEYSELDKSVQAERYLINCDGFTRYTCLMIFPDLESPRMWSIFLILSVFGLFDGPCPHYIGVTYLVFIAFPFEKDQIPYLKCIDRSLHDLCFISS